MEILWRDSSDVMQKFDSINNTWEICFDWDPEHISEADYKYMYPDLDNTDFMEDQEESQLPIQPSSFAPSQIALAATQVAAAAGIIMPLVIAP